MRLLKLVPDNTNIHFVAVRRWAFALTALLTLASIAAVGLRGLNLGVDFVGGLMIEAKFQQPPSLDKIRADVDRLAVGEASLQQFGDPKTVSIRLPLPHSTDEGATNAVVNKVKAALKTTNPDVEFTRYDTVSGKVSGELIQNGILAVIIAVLAIAVFSWLRYEWQFGVSTFVAIAHDVLMTLGFFAITRFEFDLNIVAAVLTIIGYSINDKIVIDDRIRENMRKFRKMDMGALIDLSVNETLPRTVMTSLTVLLALASLLLFGGHVLARVHRGDDARHRRRHLFVDLCLVVAADGSRAAAGEFRQEADQPGQRQRRARHQARGLMPELTPADQVTGPKVTGFAGRAIKIDGNPRPGGVILTPESADDWDGADFATAADIDPPPEFILLGTGAVLERPDPALVAAYEARGIGIEAMDTRAAARAWTLLRSEGRWISAALRGL